LGSEKVPERLVAIDFEAFRSSRVGRINGGGWYKALKERPETLPPTRQRQQTKKKMKQIDGNFV
jgi:hypothetical protein